ncbi:hypothetical protein [Pseudolactococcus insecticola]|uniref:Uncharacterized protein n=1 Tax=Pseudolactococcus insecticola TaxID=2709158 RepID=A0A6A0B576_9LACT|nr:hypothetical protein [Lactococcus insecticola]GFH39845.1 hypothetical protein Hs20B_02430 [Lactococcus insecticola]
MHSLRHPPEEVEPPVSNTPTYTYSLAAQRGQKYYIDGALALDKSADWNGSSASMFSYTMNVTSDSNGGAIGNIVVNFIVSKSSSIDASGAVKTTLNYVTLQNVSWTKTGTETSNSVGTVTIKIGDYIYSHAMTYSADNWTDEVNIKTTFAITQTAAPGETTAPIIWADVTSGRAEAIFTHSATSVATAV